MAAKAASISVSVSAVRKTTSIPSARAASCDSLRWLAKDWVLGSKSMAITCALRHHLAHQHAIYSLRDWTVAGGLMSYGPILSDTAELRPQPPPAPA